MNAYEADALPASSKAAWKLEERRRRDQRKWDELAAAVAQQKAEASKEARPAPRKRKARA